MSAATAGHPPNSHFHNSDGGKPAGVRNGYSQNGDGGKRSDKVFRHIQDLVAARPTVDINAPIRKILLEGEQHAKNADSFFDFRRPDLALEEYIKASIIAVEIIPRHKDYPELQSDRGEMHRLYQGLKKRIHSQQDRFDGAKNIIKENNNQHGTQPASSSHPNPADHHTEAVRPQTNSFDGTGDKGRPSNHIAFPPVNGLGSSAPAPGELPSTKQLQPSINSNLSKRPAVHPKPEALQGKSIKSGDLSTKTSTQSVEDLASRFARLRGGEAVSRDEISPVRPAPVQDPRIKTRPIVVPSYSGSLGSTTSNSPAQSHTRGGSLLPRPNRPSGPRDIPPLPSKPLKIALGVKIPEMPRPPEAVYSPARNLESIPHSELMTDRSKTFNHYISRTPSIESTMDLGRSVMSVDDINPYFYNAPVKNQPLTKGPRLPDLSRLEHVTAQQLQQFMQLGSQSLSILLVDIRNREDFDNGHIMWQTICIEPISLRPGVSADEIEQSMVIAPDAEQQLFMQRHKYSLVVYYDQSASSLSFGYGNGTALQDFHRAVYDYSYEKRLQNRPLLLKGGLDAWIDLVGESALVTSTSLLAAKASAQNGKNLRLLASSADPSVPKNGIVMHSETEGDEQYQDHKETVGYDHLSTPRIHEGDSTDDFYFKNAEDFMRRFPAASDIKESMMSPSNQLIAATHAPAIPQKAVTPGGTQMFSRLHSADTASAFPTLWGEGHTGLYNRGNLCYMNAAIQALSSIHELRDYLFRGAWVRSKPTRDPLEQPANLDDEQLATKTFSNLLMHLWSADAANCSYINPRTFVATINRLHLHHRGIPERNNLFGGPNQHDSEEFIQFLLQKLDDETSTASTVSDDRSDEYRKWLDEQQDISVASIDAYNRLKPENLSPIAKLMAHMFVKDTTCTNCNKQLRLVDDAITYTTIAHFPEQEKYQFTLRELLLHGRKEDLIDGFKCKYCNESSVIRQNNTFYVRLPNILVIRLTRERTVMVDMLDAEGNTYKEPKNEKIKTPVVFPEDNLDLAEFLVPGKYGPESMESTRYDCFAVVCHLGNTLKSGHYTTYRRDMTRNLTSGKKWTYKQWWSYNDTQTQRTTFQDIDQSRAYILFYRLSGTH